MRPSIRISFLAFLMALGLGFSSCKTEVVSTPATGNATISGILVDEDGNLVPLADITVTEQSVVLAQTKSDEVGNFSLDKLPENFSSLNLEINRDDIISYIGNLNSVVSNSGGNTGILLKLEHHDSCCGKVRFALTSGNDYVHGATIKLRRPGKVVSTGYTNDDGVLLFNHLCEGTVSALITKDGYKTIEKNIEVGNCDSNAFALSMEALENHSNDTCCSGSLVIHPKNSSGESLNGASIRLRRDGFEKTKTSEHGGVTFGELCAGVYSVHIAQDHYQVAEFSVTIACDSAVEMTRSLSALANSDSCCDGVLTVITLDGADTVKSATVKLGKGGVIVATKNTEGGKAAFEHVCDGLYSVNIYADHFKHQEFNVEMGCNDHKTIVRTLVRETQDSCCKGSVDVTVKDQSTSALLVNATVKIYKGSTLVKTLKTNSQGVARVEGLCEGDGYSYSASYEGYHGREASFAITCDKTTSATAALEKSANTSDTCHTASLKVHLQKIESDSALGNVTVKIYKGDHLVAEGKTNSEGNYVYEGLDAPSTYVVKFTLDGYVAKSVTFSWSECKRIEETVRLTPQ